MFFKLRPEVITDENLHNNILVSSMLESPINSLYQAVRQVFAPMLLKVSEMLVNLFFMCFGHHGNRHIYYLIYCLMCFSLFIEVFIVLGVVSDF